MMALALARGLSDRVEPLAAAARRLPAGAPLTGPPPLLPDFTASLNVLTCGSVDDGKSTLIGRLLWDAGALHIDRRQALERSPRTAAGTPDFSLLVDGLSAEREQGITIDIAWRYLDTAARRLVIIDSPGHEQYTRNMATGASHADVAILLVDARGGIKEQTRRHAAILDLIGVRRVVLAVNKMDLVGWSQARFVEIDTAFQRIAGRFAFDGALAIPISAVLGDNIASPSAAMPWYGGPLLLDHLAHLPGAVSLAGAQLRFPVQLVVRAGQDFRGLAGWVSSGEVRVGDEVAEPVSGQRARVKRIATMDRDLPSAGPGQAVVLELASDIDVSRGAILATPGLEPPVARSLDARLVWLSQEPFSPERGYLLRTATDLVPVTAIDIRAHLDLETLAERTRSTAAANDIALAHIAVGRAIAIDRFADQRQTGSFILVDAISGATVAGGVVAAAQQRQTPRQSTFRLTRDLVARGIGADLPPAGPASESELRRRANEVAILLREAGVAVELDDAWGRAGLDAGAAWRWIMATLSFAFVGAILLGLV